MLFIAFISLIGWGGDHQQEENTSEWGDSIATINNTAYYWLQLADDSARISAVRDNQLVTECIVRGPVYGARQYDDGEIYILCGQDQISWFDVRNIPSEIDLLTEEDLDNYDLSQENADATIDIGMWNKGKMLKKQWIVVVSIEKASVMCKFYAKSFVDWNKLSTFAA